MIREFALWLKKQTEEAVLMREQAQANSVEWYQCEARARAFKDVDDKLYNLILESKKVPNEPETKR